MREKEAMMFTGFPPEVMDFLWGIRLNNNREWFAQHKEQYVRCLYEPMKALAQEVFAPFQDKPGLICKVSRIYRDARLKPDTPYKESLWLCIRQASPRWEDLPCFYLEISPEGMDYGFSQWHLTAQARQNFYEGITAQPRPFQELVAQAEEAAGIPLTARLYRRPKEAPDPALAPYFAWRDNIGCVRHLDPGPELFSPELPRQVSRLFEDLWPLYEFFTRICG